MALRNGADVSGWWTSAPLATPLVNRGDLSCKATRHRRRREWPCSEGMLGLSLPRIPYCQVSSLVVADSHGSSVGPVNHVLRAIRGHIHPKSPRFASPRLRSHTSGVTLAQMECPSLISIASARLSCNSPAEPFAIGFARPNIANGSAGERSRSLADLPLPQS